MEELRLIGMYLYSIVTMKEKKGMSADPGLLMFDKLKYHAPTSPNWSEKVE